MLLEECIWSRTNSSDWRRRPKSLDIYCLNITLFSMCHRNASVLPKDGELTKKRKFSWVGCEIPSWIQCPKLLWRHTGSACSSPLFLCNILQKNAIPNWSESVATGYFFCWSYDECTSNPVQGTSSRYHRFKIWKDLSVCFVTVWRMTWKYMRGQVNFRFFSMHQSGFF